MPPLTLYFDRNFGRGLPESLGKLGLKVVHHHTEKRLLGLPCRKRTEPLFPPEEADDSWLSVVGKNGWTVFTQDQKFHKPGYESEMLAIRQYSVGCFYLWGATALRHEKALCFLKSYKRIVEAIAATPKPFIYQIDKSGKLTWVPLP